MPALEKDLDQPEAPADDAAVPEEFPQLPGPGVGHHVEVFGRLAQQQVPDAAPHQVGGVAGMVEAVKDFQGLHVNVSPGDGMFGPGNDVGWDLRRPWGFGLH